jgi:hypothetical protein
LTHGIPPLHHWIEGVTAASPAAVAWLVPSLINGAVGVVAGGIAVLLVSGAKRLLPNKAAA